MSNIHAALFLIRIASALAFLFHGGGILLGAFGGPGPERFAAGEHIPVALAYLVGLTQLAAGLAALTGIFMRLGALCIIANMLAAIAMVHVQHGFDISKGGMEYALTQLLIGLALLLTGPGAYSLNGILPPSLRRL